MPTFPSPEDAEDEEEAAFELPAAVLEEDTLLLQNLLRALHALGSDGRRPCQQYKVDPLPTGYLVRATLAPLFELGLDDLLFLQSLSPSRIERIALAREAAAATTELLVRVLDARQRVMVTSTTAFSATRKRKWTALVGSS